MEKESLIQLTITDNGKGFPKDIIDKVFEPYITTRKEGTGLGLSIVKKIIEQHNGTISLDRLPHSDDHPNFSTEVVVLLPHSV